MATSVRVLTWNLFHGRAQPPAGHDLFDQFAAALAGWPWDVALLQEVPPWWPARLGRELGVEPRRVLTSRNALLPVRQAIATRWPDAIRSNGGGANAILVRSEPVLATRVQRLSRWPERRWLIAVQLRCGVWAGTLHATVHDDARARRDGALAAETLRGWAGEETPVILGGDFNVRELALDGYTYAGGHDVDHVFLGGGLASTGSATTLERGPLSDHAPVVLDVASRYAS